jgi:sorbitol-specific phosphotransferase system component IIBC
MHSPASFIPHLENFAKGGSFAMAEEKKYRKVRIKKGPKGWGGPLIIEPKPGKDLIYSVTGGGIHPLAQHIADLTGGRPFDGFKSKADFSEIAVAVIDCGGTARVGVYPMKKVPTVDIYPTSPSGPLMRFITEEYFVSGVRPEDVELIDE